MFKGQLLRMFVYVCLIQTSFSTTSILDDTIQCRNGFDYTDSIECTDGHIPLQCPYNFSIRTDVIVGNDKNLDRATTISQTNGRPFILKKFLFVQRLERLRSRWQLNKDLANTSALLRRLMKGIDTHVTARKADTDSVTWETMLGSIILMNNMLVYQVLFNDTKGINVSYILIQWKNGMDGNVTELQACFSSHRDTFLDLSTVVTKSADIDIRVKSYDVSQIYIGSLCVVLVICIATMCTVICYKNYRQNKWNLSSQRWRRGLQMLFYCACWVVVYDASLQSPCVTGL